MNTKYYPILKSKDAEFESFEHASNHVLENTVPIFDFSKFKQLKRHKDSLTPKADFVYEICEKIAKHFQGKTVIFDTYLWPSPGEALETGEHHTSYIYNSLIGEGVLAIPTIGYDRWDDAEYRLGLKSIAKTNGGKFCLRLDSFAFDDASDHVHFQNTISEIINELQITPSECHVILDFGDISALPLIELIQKFDLLFPQIANYRFMSYSIAGCSLPTSIDKAVKHKDSVGSISRKEIQIWKDAYTRHPSISINLGDYGVRGPNTTEMAYGNTNAKIRHTIDDEFFILRGHKMEGTNSGYQHCDLAKKLIASGHYLGSGYSWGDSEIERCSNQEFGGGSTRWITIDTSHHLAHVVDEITNFELSKASTSSTIKST